MVNHSRKIKFSELSIWIMIGTIIIIFGIGGCAPRTRIFLLPDPDGHVGQVIVSSKGGEQVLSTAYETTEVASSRSLPSEPKVMDEAVVKDIFKEALEAQPMPPTHFLLYFISGTKDLTAASLKLIPQMISAIKNCLFTDISVVGHTDRVASKSYNRRLSLKRAETVAEMLILNGIDPEIIEITSHGEENPLVETPDNMAEPRNRRVEIIVR